MLRADPTELAAGWAARLEGRSGGAARAVAGRRAGRARRRSTPSSAEAPITEPALHVALGRAHRDGDLVYTASSMPIRDQESFLAAPTPTRSSSATAAPTGSTA